MSFRRYLYRGVIAESSILSDTGGRVTFEYIENDTDQRRTRTMPGEDFLWLLLRHVLPKGFQRTRSYGFLHHRARRTLLLIQYVLRVAAQMPEAAERPVFRCPRCNAPMVPIAFIPPAIQLLTTTPWPRHPEPPTRLPETPPSAQPRPESVVTR